MSDLRKQIDQDRGPLLLLMLAVANIVSALLDQPSITRPAHLLLGIALLLCTGAFGRAPRVALSAALLSVAAEAAFVVSRRDVLGNTIEGLLWPRRLLTFGVLAWVLFRPAPDRGAVPAPSGGVRASVWIGALALGALIPWLLARPNPVKLVRHSEPGLHCSIALPEDATPARNELPTRWGPLEIQVLASRGTSASYSIMTFDIADLPGCRENVSCVEDVGRELLERVGTRFESRKAIHLGSRSAIEWKASFPNDAADRFETTVRILQEGTRGYLLSATYKPLLRPAQTADFFESFRVDPE